MMAARVKRSRIGVYGQVEEILVNDRKSLENRLESRESKPGPETTENFKTTENKCCTQQWVIQVVWVMTLKTVIFILTGLTCGVEFLPLNSSSLGHIATPCGTSTGLVLLTICVIAIFRHTRIVYALQTPRRPITPRT